MFERTSPGGSRALFALLTALGLAFMAASVARAQAPVITAISAPRQVVTINQNLTLSVTAPTATSFQWKRNGRPLSGATSASHTITTATPARDNGWYQVISTNSSGSTASAAIFVNVVVTKPQIIAWGFSFASVFAPSPPAGLVNVSALAVSDGHVLALKGDGSVVAWGSNYQGETNVPTALNNVVAISANRECSLALKSDGTVMAWGSVSISAQALTDIVAISAGNNHGVALRRDGTVVVWGSGADSDLAVPAGLTNVVSIAAGNYFCVAAKTDGTVVRWGANPTGDLEVPAGLTNVVAVAASPSNSAALKADGTVTVWGQWIYGATTVPAGLAGVVSLSLGDSFAYALKGDRLTAFWGRIRFSDARQPAGFGNLVFVAAGGQSLIALGDASGGSSPVVVAPPSSVTTSLNKTASFSVSASGTAPLSYQWQRQAAGTTGFVAGPFDPSVYGGAESATLTVTGTTAAMNGDQFRCLVGNGIASDATSPAAVLAVLQTPSITSAAETVFTAGVAGEFAVTATGSPLPTFSVIGGALPAWATLNPTTGVISGTPPDGTGAPFSFTLQAANGQGSPATQAFTLRLNFAPSFSLLPARRQTVFSGQSLTLTVSAPAATSLQWKRNGRTIPGATLATYTIADAKLYRDTGWYQVVATNSDGSTTSPVIFVNVVVSPPTVVLLGTTWPPGAAGPTNLNTLAGIAAGTVHTLALQGDGTVIGWGWNTRGQLTFPSGLTDVVALSCNDVHNLALRSDGTVVAWGPNGAGQTNVPASLAHVAQVAAGAGHSLALKADGTVVAWGNNSSGQCLVPAGLSGVVALAAGSAHSVALRADGTIVAWGSNVSNQTAVPAGLSGVVSLVAQADFTLALLSSGSVLGWGTTTYGQTTIPPGLNAVALAAGPSHALAIKADGTVAAWGGSNSSGETVIPAGTDKVVAVGAGSGSSTLVRDTTVVLVPTIVTSPAGQSKGLGQTATFSVVATGTAPLAYQWQRQAAGTTGFTDLAASTVYSGVITATLTVTGTTAVMSGDQFRCLVANGIGAPATSAAVPLLVSAPPAFTSAVSAPFFINRLVSFTVAAAGSPAPTFSASGLPAWASLNATTGVLSGAAPDATGAPFTITLTASNGVAPAATQTFTLHVRLAHSADTSPADGTLNLAELTRVIELYNTRTGTVRTGRYVSAPGTVDGYAPDPTVTAGPIPTAPHTADTNRDGRLSLTELTRVIELFGTRNGTTRTGAYHVPAVPNTTEDGFALGP